jgi:hypothetical protein
MRKPGTLIFCLPGSQEFLIHEDQRMLQYLEDLVSRIDAPQLYQLSTTFFMDIDFDTPELNQFISRTPTFGVLYNKEALLFVRSDELLVRLQSLP